jgi:hypothetical protein
MRFYVRNAAAVSNDVQTFDHVYGNVTTSAPAQFDITNTQTVATDRTIGPLRTVTHTYSNYHSAPSDFTGSITGLGSSAGVPGFYVGGAATKTWSIPIPARPATFPSAPTSVSSTPGNGSMTVTFGAPTFYGGSNPPVGGDGVTISGYRYSIDGGYVYTAVPSNASPFTITGLTNGTAQTVYVVADNNAGLTSASASTTATPRTVPGAPASVTSTPSNGSVSIGFTAPSSDGGSAVTSYQHSTDNANWTTTPTNPFTVSGANGTAITVYVRAVNAAGAGAQNNATSTPRTVPSAPQSFAGSNTTFGQLSLSWAAPSSNGGNDVSSYVLRTGATVLQNTSATSYVHTGLSPYTDYSYTVTAANAAGESTAASLTVKTMGGVANVWNGTAWVTILPKVWNGTAWVNAQARMWNGTSWVHGI